MLKKTLFFACFFLFLSSLFSQTSETSSLSDLSTGFGASSNKSVENDAQILKEDKKNLENNSSTRGVASSDQKEEKVESANSIPNGFRKITLGMDLESVKKALKNDSQFGYRGERDVSLLSGPQRVLIETSGLNYIKAAWLQFSDEKLYIFTVKLNEKQLDYYSLYSSLTKKYGEPISLDPQKALWQNESVQMVLERPLTVKYIDRVVFDSLLKKSEAGVSYSELLKQDFIDEF